MTVPAGITTGFGGYGGAGGGAGAGTAATGAEEESGGFKSADGFPACAEVASEVCDCFVPSAAGADVGSDFLPQAMARESSATNSMVGFMQVIFFIISPRYFTVRGNKLELAIMTGVGFAG
jgi:hypothetical protein